MTDVEPAATWRFVRIGLVVTGDSERDFLCDLFRAIAATGHATFLTIRQTGQRTALSDKRIDQYGKRGKDIPDRDAQIGYEIRRFVAQPEHFAVWIDDLESAHRPNAAAKFQRLEQTLDAIVGKVPDLRRRCSVHFLVNMLEAYYFADTAAVNRVNMNPDSDGPETILKLANHAGDSDDCENITHPKNELDKQFRKLNPAFKFREKDHGAAIVSGLDLYRILGSPLTCRALRTLVAWCWEAIGEPRTERFHLSDGVYWDVTAGQLVDPPPAAQIGPLGPEDPYRPRVN